MKSTTDLQLFLGLPIRTGEHEDERSLKTGNPAGHRDWPNRSSLTVLTGLLASVPLVVSTVHAIHLGWIPSSDDGVIALRAFDVFSAHPPLVGQYSQTSPLISSPVYSVGPMLYWVLAIPAHIGPQALVLWMGTINTLAVVGVVAMARRRGGAWFMFLVAAAMLVMSHSLPAEVPYEVWGCWAGLFPFVGLIFLAWSVAVGDFKLLPLLVLVASYVVQCHLTYLVPTAGCVAVALAGLARQRRDAAQARTPGDGRLGARPGIRRWTFPAGVVLVASWVAPVIEQTTHRPGNLGMVARLASSGYPTRGDHEGLWAFARAIGFPPSWTRVPQTPAGAFRGLLNGPPRITEATALLMLVGLGAAFPVGLRRKRDDVAAAAALGVVLSLSVAIVARSLPAGDLGLAGGVYVLTWASPAGMFVYLALAWSAWCLLAQPLRVERISPRMGAVLGCVGILAISVLVANRTVGSSANLPPRVGSFDTIRAITARTVDGLDRRHPVLLDVANTLGGASLTFPSAIAYEMRRRGIPFAVAPHLANGLGDQYCPRAISYPDVVIILDGRVAPAGGATVLARSSDVTIALARARSAGHDQHLALARREEDAHVPSRCVRTPDVPSA